MENEQKKYKSYINSEGNPEIIAENGVISELLVFPEGAISRRKETVKKKEERDSS